MPDAYRSEVTIIGAGLAGTFLALSLCRLGASVRIIHEGQKTASHVPLALYNPAAALKARKGWEAECCQRELIRAIEELTQAGYDESEFVSRKGVIRPCLDEEMREHFLNSATQQEWPDGWVTFLEPEALKSQFPGSEYRYGGLWVAVGMTFNNPLFLDRLHELMRKKYGCEIIHERVEQISRASGKWQIVGERNRFESYIISVAAGVSVSRLADASELKLHQVKGQTMEIRRPDSVEFEASISSRGYLAQHQGRMVVGSTYEHHFTDINTTEKAAAQLTNKVTQSLPSVTQRPEMISSWAGIRVTTPDRLPLMGCLPGKENLFISVGFGSKGVMYAPLCGKLLAEHILHQTPLPFDVSISRQLPPEEQM